MRKFQQGNTVRFKCEFFDFENNKVDPSIVLLKIYNDKYKRIFEESGIRINIGEYILDYTTDDLSQRLFYEWYGEIDGKPTIKRGEFTTSFV